MFVSLWLASPVMGNGYIVTVDKQSDPDSLELKKQSSSGISGVLNTVESLKWESLDEVEKLAEVEGKTIWRVKDTRAVNADSLATQLPGVESISVDLEVRAASVNDAMYVQQWNMQMIEMERAWDVTTGSPNVTVAIIDSGIATHDDLRLSRIIDEYDFVNNDTRAEDGFGHGTAVAGVLMGTMNNQIGIAGIDQQAAILNYRILDKTGGGDLSDLIAGLQRAREHGADVINLSVTTPLPCTDTQLSGLQSLLREMSTEGIVMVAAAGNDAANAVQTSPASCDGVVTVGAVTAENEIAWYSNHGSAIDIWAPGGVGLSANSSITSTGNSNNYVIMTGTSFAAPHVTGVLSLMKSQHMNWDDELVTEMIGTSKQVNGLKIVNAGQAIAGEVMPSPTPTATITPTPTATPTAIITASPTPQPQNEEYSIVSWIRQVVLGEEENSNMWKQILADMYVTRSGSANLAQR